MVDLAKFNTSAKWETKNDDVQYFLVFYTNFE